MTHTKQTSCHLIKSDSTLETIKMATLYDLGEDLNLIVEQIQDLLNDGIDSGDDRVQELLEKMVSQEDEWESKAVNVAKFLNQ